jgi:hypothetical protein
MVPVLLLLLLPNSLTAAKPSEAPHGPLLFTHFRQEPAGKAREERLVGQTEATFEEVLKDIFGDEKEDTVPSEDKMKDASQVDLDWWMKWICTEEEDTVPSEDKMEDASQVDLDLFGTETESYDGRPAW